MLKFDDPRSREPLIVLCQWERFTANLDPDTRFKISDAMALCDRARRTRVALGGSPDEPRRTAYACRAVGRRPNACERSSAAGVAWRCESFACMSRITASLNVVGWAGAGGAHRSGRRVRRRRRHRPYRRAVRL